MSHDVTQWDGMPSRVGNRGLLIVDAPNVDATVGRMHGRTPRRHERFDPSVLGAWATDVLGPNAELTLFTNVPDPLPRGLEGWIKSLVEGGWRVYARPKKMAGDDIDDAMVAHLTSNTWSSVVVFSHDSMCFAQPLQDLAASGSTITVLGFRECAGSLSQLQGIRFVDVDDVTGLYQTPPPRIRVADVPADGGWIEWAVR